MSKDRASSDLADAAYWKAVAAADKTEIAVAFTKVKDLTADARKEEAEPNDGARRRKGLAAR